MLDPGSQFTYITPEAKSKLKLKSLGVKNVVVKTFGNKKETKPLEKVKFAIKSKDGNLNIYMEAFVSSICFPVENQFIELAKEKYSHLSNLDLADSNPEKLPLNIDILIGADHYWSIVGKTQIRGENGPVAIGTRLGYVLSGPMDFYSKKPVSNNNIVCTHFLRVEAQIQDENFLANEHIKNCLDFQKPTKNENIFNEFKETTIFENGRYQVDLPFKKNHDDIGDNFKNSKARLKSLFNNTFKENKELFIEYDKIIKEQRNLKVIETAGDYKPGETHYLPHRPVIKPNKETTKIRIVFDASCKSRQGGPSLNDILEPGPSLTPQLLDVLLRFRCYNYAMVGDIEKAFLQIGIKQEHRDYVRFLWFQDIDNIDFENFDNNPLVEYRFCRVLFGVTSSSFLLAGTLNKHVNSSENHDQVFKEKLLNSLHVDDLNSGCNSIEEGVEFYSSSKKCLAKGGFNLRKFKSNSKHLENKIYEKYPDDEIFSEGEKVLGLIWDKNSDIFYLILMKFVKSLVQKQPNGQLFNR